MGGAGAKISHSITGGIRAIQQEDVFGSNKSSRKGLLLILIND